MGGDPQFGLFQGIPNNDPIHVLVRIYVIRVRVNTENMFQGIPNNDPIHVLVRIYVIRVRVKTENRFQGIPNNDPIHVLVRIYVIRVRVITENKHINRQLNCREKSHIKHFVVQASEFLPNLSFHFHCLNTTLISSMTWCYSGDIVAFYL